MAIETFDGLRRVITYGYDDEGDFTIALECRVEDDAGEMIEGPYYEGPVELTRTECQSILKHMQFGKKGDMRVFETLNGKKV